jgi:hypothetical protein
MLASATIFCSGVFVTAVCAADSLVPSRPVVSSRNRNLLGVGALYCS